MNGRDLHPGVDEMRVEVAGVERLHADAESE